MESTDIQRIDELKFFLKVKSYSEFSREIGLKNSQIFTDIRHKKQGINKKLAEKIVTRYPEVSYLWLLTGEGPMLVGGEEQKATVNGDNNTTINGHDITVPAASKIEQLYEARLQDKDALINALQDRVSHQREVIDSLTATLSTLKP